MNPYKDGTRHAGRCTQVAVHRGGFKGLTACAADPERWPNGFLKVLRTKKDGFWTYWRDHRECEDKYLRQVKIFRYD